MSAFDDLENLFNASDNEDNAEFEIENTEHAQRVLKEYIPHCSVDLRTYPLIKEFINKGDIGLMDEFDREMNLLINETVENEGKSELYAVLNFLQNFDGLDYQTGYY